MKILLLILLVFSCAAYGQDSTIKKFKYPLVIGFGVGKGQYIYGGPSLNIAGGIRFTNNTLLLSIFGYTELQIFGAMHTDTYEVALVYHRCFPLGKLEPALGAGISFNKYIMDTARFSGRTSFKTIDMTSAGYPLYISIGYRIRKWKLEAQYHYNFNSINEFQGRSINFCFLL